MSGRKDDGKGAGSEKRFVCARAGAQRVGRSPALKVNGKAGKTAPVRGGHKA